MNGYVVIKNADKFGDLSLQIWDTYDRLFPNPLTTEMIQKGVLTFPTAAGPISWGWPLELNKKQIPGAHILDVCSASQH